MSEDIEGRDNIEGRLKSQEKGISKWFRALVAVYLMQMFVNLLQKIGFIYFILLYGSFIQEILSSINKSYYLVNKSNA